MFNPAGNQQVLFAAAQIRNASYEGCFVAVNGFSGAAPWYAAGWVLNEPGGELLAHFDDEQMSKVGDFAHAASPKEIIHALNKAYLQLFRRNLKH